MKRGLAFLLILILTFVVSCQPEVVANALSNNNCGEILWEQAPESSQSVSLTLDDDPSGLDSVAVSNVIFSNLMANELYLQMAETLCDAGYENPVIHIDVSYYSKEYLDELAFNSQENIYYGQKLSDLDKLFEGTRYVFTCSDDGITTVKEFEAYDDTYERALRNVAVGTGIIIVCVTVTLATGGFGAPVVAGSAVSAVNVIFSAASTGSAISALSGGAISSIVTGTIVATQTHDWEETKKAVALAGSEGFMWGAVIGSGTGMISGAIQYGQMLKAVKALPQTSLDVILRNTPVEGNTGKWINGTRGNGEFVPSDPAMKQILAEKGLGGITYKNGNPDFSPFAYEKIEITGKYLDNLVNPNSFQVRQAMQMEAKELLAKQRNVLISDINNWIKANRISIHEDINMTTLSFVPREINSYFQHLGGVSEYLSRIAQSL